MADLLRTDAYIACIKDFLDDSAESNFIINEIEKKNPDDNSNDVNNSIVERKQFFKNGVVSSYVNEVLQFSSKKEFIKVITVFNHNRKLKKYRFLITTGFLSKYRKDTHTDNQTAYDRPLKIFKVDFQDRLKEIAKLIEMYKLVVQRNHRFQRLVRHLMATQEKLNNPKLSRNQRQAYISKIAKLNTKHEVVFMDHKTNLLQAFQAKINTFKEWLNSDLDFFKCGVDNYGFLNVFIDSKIPSKHLIYRFDTFSNLVRDCLNGLELYKKAMDNYGYKVSKASDTATAINTNI